DDVLLPQAGGREPGSLSGDRRSRPGQRGGGRFLVVTGSAFSARLTTQPGYVGVTSRRRGRIRRSPEVTSRIIRHTAGRGVGREGIILRPLHRVRLVSVVAVGSLVLAVAACGKPPASNSGSSGASSAGKAAHACMVTDTGGINDRSFNAAAWAG